MDLKNITIGQYLKESVEKFPDNIGIISRGEETLTWSMIDKLSDDYAKGFMALGLKKGDHLAIWGTNNVKWIICFLAASKIGVCTVTVNINYRLEEVEKLLNHSDAKALIFMDGIRDISYIDIVKKIRVRADEGRENSCQLLEHLIHFEDEKCEAVISLLDVLEKGKKTTSKEFENRKKELSADDVINIQFTSGTTSSSKGVMLTHNNLVNNSYFTGKLLNLTEKDRLCLALPLFHCFGLSAGALMCIGTQSTMVLVGTYRTVEVMNVVSKEKCTVLHGVPTMFARILEHKDFEKYDFTNIRTGLVAGATCNEKTLRGIIEKLGIENIEIGYGQTESSPGCTQTTKEDSILKKLTTIGKPLPHTEVKILDAITGKECPIGIKGEICTRGYHVMKGYYKNEVLTHNAIDKNSFLHTGDVGYKDSEGYYHLCGRIKDTIIRGGENISPLEIENYLLKHMCIKDAQVYGVPDESYGEEIVASILVEDGVILEIKEIKDFLKDKLAHYKIPKYIEFRKKYPMTANGKIQKNVLKEEMSKKIMNVDYLVYESRRELK